MSVSSTAAVVDDFQIPTIPVGKLAPWALFSFLLAAIAVFFVSADGGHSYSPTDVDMAEDLAARCAIALDNSRLYRDLEAVRRNSVQLNEQLVLASIR